MAMLDVRRRTLPFDAVVRKFISDKEEAVSRRQDGRPGQQIVSTRIPIKPLILHDHVFHVSPKRRSANNLRKWIVKAASGEECPAEFDFPAVNQTVPKAWIDAYSTMEGLGKKTPCVLWSEAVEEFSGMFKTPHDSGAVLLRAMQHREAEGGVLLSLSGDSAPREDDMLHLDPTWLIELVRRLADHNLVKEEKQDAILEELQSYAERQNLDLEPLVDTHRCRNRTTLRGVQRPPGRCS